MHISCSTLYLQCSNLLWNDIQIYQWLCHTSKETFGGDGPYSLTSLFHKILIVQHSLWLHLWSSLILEDFFPINLLWRALMH